jgi:hypothetical protein
VKKEVIYKLMKIALSLCRIQHPHSSGYEELSSEDIILCSPLKIN